MAKRRQSVTIKHVAADAGVSLQTVSRVINNEPYVRAAMAARVRESIARLGYVPSIAAQRMGGSRSYLLMALNDREKTIAEWRGRQGTDWVDQMLLGGMLKCAEHGYRLVIELVDTHSDHIERELSAAISALQPDGVILTPPHSANPLILNLLESRGIGFARIGSITPGPGYALTMGDEHAAGLATRHLLALGHRRIGLIAGPEEYELSAWRVAGWRDALGVAGIAADDLLRRGDFSYESGRAAAADLLALADPPTAIIGSNDQMTLAAMEVGRRRGLAVPGDLSLVSFDDTPIVRFAQPPLTAIVQPVADVTARAAELLIEGSDAAMPASPIVVPADLVIRGSTGPRADRHDQVR